MRTPPHTWVPSGRRLVVLDIENAAGGPCFGLETGRRIVKTVFDLAGVGPLDHVIVASNPAIGTAVGTSCPGARLVVRRGPDGADLALLDAIDPDDAARRYFEVVICSGDHVFAPTARALQARGVPVTIVAREGALSRELASAADTILILGSRRPEVAA